MPLLYRDIAICEDRIRELQGHLEIAGDVKRLKAWLKGIALRRHRDPDFDVPF